MQTQSWRQQNTHTGESLESLTSYLPSIFLLQSRYKSLGNWRGHRSATEEQTLNHKYQLYIFRSFLFPKIYLQRKHTSSKGIFNQSIFKVMSQKVKHEKQVTENVMERKTHRPKGVITQEDITEAHSLRASPDILFNLFTCQMRKTYYRFHRLLQPFTSSYSLKSGSDLKCDEDHTHMSYYNSQYQMLYLQILKSHKEK